VFQVAGQLLEEGAECGLQVRSCRKDFKIFKSRWCGDKVQKQNWRELRVELENCKTAALNC